MATTPNFNWSTPDNTGLVKNGALDIRTLGNSIDASMAELKGGTTGQVLSKTSNTDMDFTWVAQDDSNAIQNAIVDAKGDLIAASAADTPARLGVGANDTMLIADSTQSTGLAWKTAATQFPWATWTPSFGGFSLGNGSVVARYQKIGKLVNASFGITLGTTSSMTSRFYFTMPSSSANIRPCSSYANLAGAPFATPTQAFLGVSGNLCYVDAINTAGTYAAGTAFGSTVPFTWITGSEVVVFMTYEEV